MVLSDGKIHVVSRACFMHGREKRGTLSENSCISLPHNTLIRMEDPLLAQFQKEVQQDDRHSDRDTGSESGEEEANVEVKQGGHWTMTDKGVDTLTLGRQ